MPPLATNIRQQVVGAERRLREAAPHVSLTKYLRMLREIDLDFYWNDIVIAAAIQGRLMSQPQTARRAFLDEFADVHELGPLGRLTVAYSEGLVG